MDGREGSVVACIHGLQHVNGFAAADLTDYYAVWSHTQSVSNQISL
jgi:hypothetical protein